MDIRYPLYGYPSDSFSRAKWSDNTLHYERNNRSVVISHDATFQLPTRVPSDTSSDTWKASMVQISKRIIAPFQIQHRVCAAPSLEPHSHSRRHPVTEAGKGIRASQYRRIINDQGIRASQYRRIINDQGIRASQYRRICNDQGIRASQYRRTCDGHSKPRAYKNSSDGWSRFYNGSNLTIQFPQKGNIEFIFYRNKSPASTSRCNNQIRVSVPSVSSISGWGWPPHSTHITSSAFRAYLRHSDSHHNTLGHKYPNILSGGDSWYPTGIFLLKLLLLSYKIVTCRARHPDPEETRTSLPIGLSDG